MRLVLISNPFLVLYPYPFWYIFRKVMNNYVSSDEWRGASRSRFGISLGNCRGVLCKSYFNYI